MSDLVEKLRTVAEDYDFHDNALVYEAADEIDRLRAGGCARNQRTTQFCAEAVDANARAQRAEAQVAALREALQKLITHTLDCEKQLDEFHGLGDDAGSGMSSVVCDARAALEEK